LGILIHEITNALDGFKLLGQGVEQLINKDFKGFSETMKEVGGKVANIIRYQYKTNKYGKRNEG